MNPTPIQIEPLSPSQMFISWTNQEKYAVPYIEIRFACPCAGCINEHTGERMVQKTSLPSDVRPTQVELVGRYAVKITWSDRHNTGIYHYDRLFDICQKQGFRLPAVTLESSPAK